MNQHHRQVMNGISNSKQNMTMQKMPQTILTTTTTSCTTTSSNINGQRLQPILEPLKNDLQEAEQDILTLLKQLKHLQHENLSLIKRNHKLERKLLSYKSENRQLRFKNFQQQQEEEEVMTRANGTTAASFQNQNHHFNKENPSIVLSTENATGKTLEQPLANNNLHQSFSSQDTTSDGDGDGADLRLLSYRNEVDDYHDHMDHPVYIKNQCNRIKTDTNKEDITKSNHCLNIRQHDTSIRNAGLPKVSILNSPTSNRESRRHVKGHIGLKLSATAASQKRRSISQPRNSLRRAGLSKSDPLVCDATRAESKDHHAILFDCNNEGRAAAASKKLQRSTGDVADTTTTSSRNLALGGTTKNAPVTQRKGTPTLSRYHPLRRNNSFTMRAITNSLLSAKNEEGAYPRHNRHGDGGHDYDDDSVGSLLLMSFSDFQASFKETQAYLNASQEWD